MTIYQLMNTANVTPDVHINIFNKGTLVFTGRYDQTSETTRSAEVTEFIVKHLNDKGYRTDIDQMNIYTWETNC